MDEDVGVIEERLTLAEKPLLTNIVKRFFLLVEEAKKEESGEKRKQIGEALLHDLEVLAVEFGGSGRAVDRAEEQHALYEQAMGRIGEAREGVEAEVTHLRERLAEEKVKRRHNEEYDMLASKIAEYPQREQTQAALLDVQRQLSALESQSVDLEAQKARRTKQFSLLLFAISELQRELDHDESTDE